MCETVYSIRVEGYRDSCWPACCAGLTIMDHGDGSATLRGPLADVATLRRVLLALSACGLGVLTVRRTRPCPVYA
jgi:hypothetical protein